MIVFNKLKKNTIKKVVCYFLVAIICFACGNVYHEYNLIQNNSDEISCSINALRDEIIIMSNIISRPDYVLSEHDKSDWFRIELYAAQIYIQMNALRSQVNGNMFFSENLQYARPSVKFLTDYSYEIMRMKWEEYPKLYEKSELLLNCDPQADLWGWLDAIDVELID
jgi:hypothetical protein